MRKKLIVSLSILMMFFLVGCGLLGQVNQPAVNSAPIANFTFTPTTPRTNQVVTFNASSCTDSSDTINQLQTRWDFDGDGNWELDFSAGKRASDVVTYSYSTAGTYNATLEVKDSGGLQDSQVKHITVTIGLDQSPSARFSYTPTEPLVNETVTFDASASNDEEDTVSQLKVKWDFNNDGLWEIDYTDGYMATNVVTYNYSQAGNYTVILEVKDSSGLTSKYSKAFSVSEQSTDSYQISGHIVESRGGSGIDNAELSLVSNSNKKYYTTTDANGKFSFQVTELVPHQLSVTKSGYSNSSAQGILPDQTYSTDLSIPLREESYSGYGDNWPELYITGLSDSLSGVKDYTIYSTSDLAIKSGEVQYGPHGYNENGTFFGDTPITLELDTTSLPNGETYIRVSLYDVNENYVELYQNISIANEQVVPLLNPPTIKSLQAVTTGSSLQLLSEESKNSLSTEIGQNVSLDEIQIQAAYSDSTVFTVLEWTKELDASGYKIYRSMTSDHSDYTLVGVINDPDTEIFIDTSAILTPGTIVYYKISSYDYSGESDLSSEVYTTPLEPFRVSLVSPDVDEVVTVPNPTLSWEYNQMVGQNRYYRLKVRGVTDSIESWDTTETNRINVEYAGYPLKSGKEYEWNIEEAYAKTEYTSTSSAISYSSDNYTAMNGGYRFRTEF